MRTDLGEKGPDAAGKNTMSQNRQMHLNLIQEMQLISKFAEHTLARVGKNVDLSPQFIHEQLKATNIPGALSAQPFIDRQTKG